MSEGATPDPAATPARAARPEWVGRALFESVLIVLSVLLGFAITEWRDRRATRARAEQALVALRSELDSNRAAVMRARRHHREIRDSVQAYVSRGEVPPERVYFYGMFSPAYVLGTAWQSAREGGAVNELPFPIVVRLAGVYERQTQYRELSDAILGSIYGDMMRRGALPIFRDGAANFIMLQRDFADREATLEALYDSALVHVRRARPR